MLRTRVSTWIQISEATKRKLEAVKRDGESFDDLLDRLAVARTPEDVEAMAGIAGDAGIEDHVVDRNDDLSASLDENARRE